MVSDFNRSLSQMRCCLHRLNALSEINWVRGNHAIFNRLSKNLELFIINCLIRQSLITLFLICSPIKLDVILSQLILSSESIKHLDYHPIISSWDLSNLSNKYSLLHHYSHRGTLSFSKRWLPSSSFHSHSKTRSPRNNQPHNDQP